MEKPPRILPRLVALLALAVSVYAGKHSSMTTAQTIALVIGGGTVLVFGEFFIERHIYTRDKWLRKSPCKKCGLLKPGFYLYESDNAGGLVCANCYEKAQGRPPLAMVDRARSKYIQRLVRKVEKAQKEAK